VNHDDREAEHGGWVLTSFFPRFHFHIHIQYRLVGVGRERVGRRLLAHRTNDGGGGGSRFTLPAPRCFSAQATAATATSTRAASGLKDLTRSPEGEKREEKRKRLFLAGLEPRCALIDAELARARSNCAVIDHAQGPVQHEVLVSGLPPASSGGLPRPVGSTNLTRAFNPTGNILQRHCILRARKNRDTGRMDECQCNVHTPSLCLNSYTFKYSFYLKS
jgi:hypothetical protein